jgi:hypothetical protein
MAKKPSIALSQEAEVGVKWKVQRGWRAGHGRTAGYFLGGIVVENCVDRLAGGNLAFPGLAHDGVRADPLDDLRPPDMLLRRVAIQGWKPIKIGGPDSKRKTVLLLQTRTPRVRPPSYQEPFMMRLSGDRTVSERVSSAHWVAICWQ